MSIAQFTGRIYPDKTFSIGIVPSPKKTAYDRQHDRAWEAQHDSYTIVEKSYRGVERTTETFLTQKSDYSLFIKPPESSQKRGKYGGKGITSYGKKVVVNSALLLQKKHGNKKLGFGTLTLPGFEPEILKYICSSWGEVVRRFFQKYKRSCEEKGCPYDYVSCTEVQPKRYARTSIPVLHVHFVYQARRFGRDCSFFHDPAEFRRFWRESIQETIRKSGLHTCKQINYIPTVHVQLVKKSASGYLGKYLSKGGAIVREIIEAGQGFLLPGQWWSASHGCKQMFKESIVCMDAKTAMGVFYGLESYIHEGNVIWGKYIEVERGSEHYKVGCVGIFDTITYEILTDTIRGG